MKRKTAVLTATSMAAIVLMASATAFACTVFKGTLTIKGNASTTSVTATGSATTMAATISPGIAKAKKTAGTVTVTTGRDAYGRGLPANPYLIRYYNSGGPNPFGAPGPGYTDHYHWSIDCMQGDAGVQIGTASVGSDGKLVGGSKTLAITSANTDTSPGESAVCISDAGGAFGLQAPVTIVL